MGGGGGKRGRGAVGNPTAIPVGTRKELFLIWIFVGVKILFLLS